MKNHVVFVFLALSFLAVGCTAVHDGLETGGTYVGKGVDAAGGFTEGAAEGYVGTTPTEEENPYGR